MTKVLKPKKKRRRLRTTNIIDVIRVRDKKRKEEKKKEREEWEERRMNDLNLEIPPAKNLPNIEEVMEELGSQPTPDITSEVMQKVRTVQKVATTARKLSGIYVRILRKAALKVHAGISLLAHRSLVERSGGDDEIVGLRKKLKGLEIDRERMKRELDEAALSRKEVERLQRENKELKARIRKLEDDLLEMKGRFIAEMDGGNRRAGEGSGALLDSLAPLLLQQSPLTAISDKSRGRRASPRGGW